MGLLDKAVDAAKKVSNVAQEGLAEAKDKGDLCDGYGWRRSAEAVLAKTPA